MKINPKYSLMFGIILFLGGGITALQYDNLFVGGLWMFLGGLFSAWLIHELWNQATSNSKDETQGANKQ